MTPQGNYKVALKLHTGSTTHTRQARVTGAGVCGGRSIALQLPLPQELSLRMCTINDPGSMQGRVLVIIVFHCRGHSTKCLV